PDNLEIRAPPEGLDHRVGFAQQFYAGQSGNVVDRNEQVRWRIGGLARIASVRQGNGAEVLLALREVKAAVANRRAENREFGRQIDFVQHVVGLICRRDANRGSWPAIPPPPGSRGQFNQVLVLREEPVHRPGEWKNVLDLRLVAVGRIDTQQLLAGKRQDAVVVHRGAARLAWMVDGAAQGERVAIEIDELNPARVAV